MIDRDQTGKPWPQNRLVRLAGMFLALSLSTVSPGDGQAAEIQWRADPPPGMVIDESLDMVLLQMAAHHGLKAVVSEELEGRVTLSFNGMTIDQIMDELAMAHQFDWFYDGQTVYFFPISSIGQQILQLDDFDVDRLIGVLDDLQLLDARYPITGSAAADVAMITGPPQYIALVEQAMTAMAEGADQADADRPPSPAAAASGDEETGRIERCPPLTRRADCLPRINYGYKPSH